ncbi:MAG: ribokinase [Alphaproteobacteria bacterium]
MITVFGSINADFILALKDFPAPKETVLCPSYEIKIGGKGANQAAAASLSGGSVEMFGTVGRDDFGSFAKGKMAHKGVDISNIKEGDAPTAVAIVMVDSKGENSIVVASGANLLSKAEDVPDEALSNDKVLVLQMEVSKEENFKLLKRAKKLGAKTILNVAPAAELPNDILPFVDYLIVNEVEALMVAKSLKIKGSDIAVILKKISEVSKGVCIATLGGDGVLAVSDKEEIKVEAIKIKPVDTTGAGDAFVGIFAAAVDEGLNLKDALKRASVGASLACLGLGAQEALPTRNDILVKIAEEA